MSLTNGSRLGPYEILGPLGAGGMGEVYRARDSKLNREVAIKILPDVFAVMLRSRGNRHVSLIFNWPADLARLVGAAVASDR